MVYRTQRIEVSHSLFDLVIRVRIRCYTRKIRVRPASAFASQDFIAIKARIAPDFVPSEFDLGGRGPGHNEPSRDRRRTLVLRGGDCEFPGIRRGLAGWHRSLQISIQPI